MNRFGVVGAMALGMTLGWACSGVHTKMLASDPPDASAQGPDGGGGESLVIEPECVVDLEAGTVEATIPDPPMTIERPSTVTVWTCGSVDQDGVQYGLGRCYVSDDPIWIDETGLHLKCGSVNLSEPGMWSKTIAVRVAFR